MAKKTTEAPQVPNEIEIVPIGAIKKNPNNPRTIKDASFKKLVNSVKSFPEMLEIRPIVVNKEGIIIGGNMRYEACKSAGLKEVPIIRATNLTPEQEREFIIKDNVSGGEWDMDMLANEWDLEKLIDWGLDVPSVEEEIDNLEDGEEIEVPQSVQLTPPKEYILIMAEPNSEEWEELKMFLKLGMVRRGGYKEGSPFDAVGLERVLEYSEFKKRISDANSSTKQG